VRHGDALAASDVVRRMASERPGVVLALGGPAAGEVAEAHLALRLPEEPAAAVDALRTAMRDTAPRPAP
jgi:hypothetical protein